MSLGIFRPINYKFRSKIIQAFMPKIWFTHQIEVRMNLVFLFDDKYKIVMEI